MTDTVLVFGASGFVGRNLVDQLVADGRDVIGITRTGAPVPGVRRTIALDDLQSIGSLPKETQVCHVAAYRYDSARFNLAQSDILTHNSILNARVLQFCADQNITELRLASSVAVYETGLDAMDDAVPINLNASPHDGEAFYAWSKRMLEVAAGLYSQRFGMNVIVFRLSNPYGKYDSTNPQKAHVAPAFVMKALDENPVFPIRGDPLVERDFTYVGDVVDGFARSLAWRGRTDTFNLCSGVTTTLQTLAETVLDVAGVEKPIEAGAPGAFGPAKRPSTSDRIKAEFGMQFTPLDEGMKPTIAWYRDEFCC